MSPLALDKQGRSIDIPSSGVLSDVMIKGHWRPQRTAVEGRTSMSYILVHGAGRIPDDPASRERQASSGEGCGSRVSIAVSVRRAGARRASRSPR